MLVIQAGEVEAGGFLGFAGQPAWVCLVSSRLMTKQQTTRRETGAIEMVQLVKALAVKAELDPQNPQSRRRELSPTSCPLMCMFIRCGEHTHAHTLNM